MQCKYCGSDLKNAAVLKKDGSDSARIHVLEWWKCRNCRAVYFAELIHYESDESIEHAVYEALPTNWEKEVELALSCPKPQRKDCHCKAHRHNFNYDYKKMVAYFVSK